MRGSLAGILLILSTAGAGAQGGDRMLGIDMNRDKAENRIEQLHQDKSDTAKARAEKPGSSKKKTTPSKSPKKKDY